MAALLQPRHQRPPGIEQGPGDPVLVQQRGKDSGVLKVDGSQIAPQEVLAVQVQTTVDERPDPAKDQRAAETGVVEGITGDTVPASHVDGSENTQSLVGMWVRPIGAADQGYQQNAGPSGRASAEPVGEPSAEAIERPGTLVARTGGRALIAQGAGQQQRADQPEQRDMSDVVQCHMDQRQQQEQAQRRQTQALRQGVGHQQQQPEFQRLRFVKVGRLPFRDHVEQVWMAIEQRRKQYAPDAVRGQQCHAQAGNQEAQPRPGELSASRPRCR